MFSILVVLVVARLHEFIKKVQNCTQEKSDLTLYKLNYNLNFLYLFCMEFLYIWGDINLKCFISLILFQMVCAFLNSVLNYLLKHRIRVNFIILVKFQHICLTVLLILFFKCFQIFLYTNISLDYKHLVYSFKKVYRAHVIYSSPQGLKVAEP